MLNKKENVEKIQVSLSIIVPIFNAAEYLCQCLNSILTQKYSDFELILVNDGSSDASGEICEKYKRQNNNIVYICQENAGLVSARRAGISAASGQYIGFVDADDWIDKDYFQRMVRIAQEYGLDVVCSKYLESSKTEEFEAPDQQKSGYYTREKLYSLKQNMMYMDPYYSFGIYPSLWSKIIKREHLMKWQTSVPHKITLGEDAAVFYAVMLKECQKVYILNDNFGYHYRQTPDSMVHKFNGKLTRNVMALMRYLEKVFEDEEDGFQRQKQLYYLMLIKWCIGNELNSKNGIREKIHKIKELRHFSPVSETLENNIYQATPTSSRILFELFKREWYFSLVNLAVIYRLYLNIKRK